MQRLFALTVFTFVFAISQLQAQKLMTYNLRYDNPNDGVNRWEMRKENVRDLILKYSPDVFGTQEGLHHQLEYLHKNLKEYSYVGVGRDDGKTTGEYCAIFYKHNELKLVQESTFWLSETPDNISIGWDAVLERICTYTLFEELDTGERFFVFNTHFDHVGKEAQYESAKLILTRIKALNIQKYPFVLMGDLNLKPGSKAIQFLSKKLTDTHNFLENDTVLGTYNAFEHSNPVTSRIDYIFADKSKKVKSYKIIEDKIEDRFPSDHLPVLVELSN